MKKKILDLEIIKSIRKFWPMKPITKVIPSKKIYDRKKKIEKEE